jgi:hypothetical protein
MKLRPSALAVLLTLAGCATNQRGALASFSVNATSHNSLIVDRRPRYGDGQPDGCIIQTAFSLQLQATSADSVSGFLCEAGTTIPVPFATIRALPQHSTEAITLLANSAGHFAISRLWKIQRLDISRHGYRTLTVNLASKTFF